MRIDQQELQESLNRAMVRHHVPGASVVVFHEGQIFTAAAGIANRNTGVEVTAETVMHIGSITKVLNATLVMQLVDDGLVALDQPVRHCLPELRLLDRDALERITVEMLLNHTAGIDGDMLPNAGHDEETIEKAVQRFAGLGQIHAPGVEFSYCNAGTVIAGFLVQRLRGKSWYQVLKERIIGPLGMKHSAVLPEEALLYRASVGHFVNPALPAEPIPTSCVFLPMSFAPAGTTLMMSARDLTTFACAQLAGGLGSNGNRILSERSAVAMRQATVDNRGKGYNWTDSMGLGWMLFDDGLLHHAGGGPGIVSVLYAHPRHQFAVAILTNAAHGFGLINELLQPWFENMGTAKPVGWAEVSRPSQNIDVDPDRYVGVYENVVNRFNVSRTPSGLALSQQAKFAPYNNMSTEATPPTPLVPLGNEKFLLDAEGGKADPSSDGFRLFAFRNPDAIGRMQHIGNGVRLYKRVP